ncbi:MAG: excinuclease ABC subunit UvrA [Clostridiales bacterium]|nr:excinuclease ABC subunit UvrA [Clostridiales bacterium]
MAKNIIIKGAKVNNLKNIDVTIPRDSLTVFTGLSGSGKSSLAFDTIYAEGQRRYVESLSSYARQFLGQMDKPDVESIDGLSPAISIDQKTTSRNPRSTVGTVTEIYDYMRLLYARIGVPHCPVCNREIHRQTTDDITDKILELEEKTKIQILSPVARGKKGEFVKELTQIRKQGFARVRIDSIVYDLNETVKLDKNKKHNIDVIVDRLIVKDGIRSRLAESIETATNLSGSLVTVSVQDGEEMMFSLNYACPEHGVSVEELEPRSFSFNNPFGACKKCSGLGNFMKVNPSLVVPDENLSINDGAVKAGGWSSEPNSFGRMYYEALSKEYGFSLDTPFKKLSKEAKNILFYGTGGKKIKCVRETSFGKSEYTTDFEGIITNLERRWSETGSEAARSAIESCMSDEICPDCGGSRLKKESLAVTVGGINIAQLTEKSVTDEIAFFDGLVLTDKEKLISRQIIKEIRSRLNFLLSVGLGYLSLSRASATLSGGEAQRIRLATQIGSSLMGVLYILDEPSIGLHQRDNARLLSTLKNLRDIGNTLIVVEHDEETMLNADYIVDVGPGAGIHGGEVVVSGSPQDVIECRESVTGDYLSGRKKIPVPEKRRKGNGKSLVVRGAKENNLRNIDVSFPLGQFVCVTGVSGSGKSSLVNEILSKYLACELNGAKKICGKCDRIDGIEFVDKVINIDQSPIGKTPRSNPATYTGVFTDIRELFAMSQDAKKRGYKPNRFSFNVKGGRCEACQGDGILKIEMQFLSDVYVPCEVCGGKRYNHETLEVKYKGKNISDILEMTVEEAMNFFASLPKIYRKLATLYDVGLGYVRLGQSSTTLSGGEAQRVKLATELSKTSTGRTVYILDEPTTGLHTADVHRLIDVLNLLVDRGNSVIVIEHNLDMIKVADTVIDLGPEGGDGGGLVVACGTPEQVAQCDKSYTGQYLKKTLGV